MSLYDPGNHSKRPSIHTGRNGTLEIKIGDGHQLADFSKTENDPKIGQKSQNWLFEALNFLRESGSTHFSQFHIITDEVLGKKLEKNAKKLHTSQTLGP